MTLHNGPWKLSDLDSIEKNGLTVFSCFHCGGGSTMGYKLSGYKVLGGVEIDKKMMEIYKTNHNPEISYLMGVQDFHKLKDIPEKLLNLDILDGSPPCSSFSTAGSRSKGWGKTKKFAEGQVKQRLDNLFFDFIKIANLLKPKVVVAENVKGLIIGNAKGFVKQIFADFNAIGYDCQLFLLNSSRMGVPSIRNRVFFIARSRDLDFPKLVLDFSETPVSIEKAFQNIQDHRGIAKTPPSRAHIWDLCAPGDVFSKHNDRGIYFNSIRLNKNYPCPTILASAGCCYMHYSEKRRLSTTELIRVQSFPDDFNFCESDPQYVIGMSVPPYMMERLSSEIKRQWFS